MAGMDAALDSLHELLGEKHYNWLTPETPLLSSNFMKSKSSIRVILALLAIAAAAVVLSNNAEAGSRRSTAPPPPTGSGVGPAVSLP